MDSIVQNMSFVIDVKNGLTEQPQRSLLMKGDKNANRVIVRLVDGGKAVDLGEATVTGTFELCGIKMPLEGEATGNEASIVLADECYGDSGHYKMWMHLTAGGVTRTILYISGYVESNGAGSLFDPENVIPSVEDIIAQYATMQSVTAQTEAARDAALEAAKSANFTILDRYATYSQLVTAHPTGSAGDAYAVGTADSNVVYVWGTDSLTWVNIGAVQGAPGKTPVRGTDYWTASDIAEIKGYVDDAILGGAW